MILGMTLVSRGKRSSPGNTRDGDERSSDGGGNDGGNGNNDGDGFSSRVALSATRATAMDSVAVTGRRRQGHVGSNCDGRQTSCHMKSLAMWEILRGAACLRSWSFAKCAPALLCARFSVGARARVVTTRSSGFRCCLPTLSKSTINYRKHGGKRAYFVESPFLSQRTPANVTAE